MRETIFNPETIWCIHSPRSGEYWFVKCPSRSGAKIFLCGPLGPQVPTSKGPFESWEYPKEDIPDSVEVLQATFFAANDPRNWKPRDESESKVQSPNVEKSSGNAAGDSDSAHGPGEEQGT
jgi:hypothetical protein